MSLVPARYNFTVYQGATFYKRLTLQVDGVIQPVAGYTVSIPIKTGPDGTTLLTLDNVTNGGVTLEAEPGTIDLFILSNVTESLTWRTGYYELFITDLTPKTDILLSGGFKVIPF